MKLNSIIKSRTTVFIFIFILSFLLIHIVQAVTADQGSSQDGLVIASQGYVDKKVNELNAKIDTAAAAVNSLDTEADALSLSIGSLNTKVDPLKVKLESLNTEIDNLKKQVESINEQINRTDGDNTGSPSQTEAFVTVRAAAGQQLTAEGGSEFILISGKAKAIAGKSSGPFDVAAGTFLKTGIYIRTNHLIIITKNDGRGLKAVSDIVLAIKGKYVIK